MNDIPDLPDTCKPVKNRVATWVVLGADAFQKLKYWEVYQKRDGSWWAVSPVRKHLPLSTFGSFVPLHYENRIAAPFLEVIK